MNDRSLPRLFLVSGALTPLPFGPDKAERNATLDPLPIKTSRQDLVLINNFFIQSCHFKILLIPIHI